MPSTIKTHVRKLGREGRVHTNKGSLFPRFPLYPSSLEDILCDYAMLIKEDRILHQWRFPFVASLKQVHINLDEYNDEDYVNFDMIDETL